MEGRYKKCKIELVSPAAAYQVFRIKDLRNIILPMLPVISWLCIWQAFPLLYKVVDIRKKVWELFEAKVLPMYGIWDPSWMPTYTHAFTGSRVVEFLLGEPFGCTKDGNELHSDLDVLICDPKKNQGFIHDVPRNVDTVNILMLPKCFGMIYKDRELLNGIRVPIPDEDVPHMGYDRHFPCRIIYKTSSTYMRGEYETTSYKTPVDGWKADPPLADHECRYIDFIKSNAPTTDLCVAQYDLDCCKVSINANRIKICSLDALVKKKFAFKIDEYFVQIYPKKCSDSYLITEPDMYEIFGRIYKYRNRGFDINIERVSDTPDGVKAYLSTHLMFGLEQEDVGLDVLNKDELAHRESNISLWISYVDKLMIEIKRWSD